MRPFAFGLLMGTAWLIWKRQMEMEREITGYLVRQRKELQDVLEDWAKSTIKQIQGALPSSRESYAQVEREARDRQARR